MSKALVFDELLFNLNPTYALLLVVLFFAPPFTAGIVILESLYRSYFESLVYIESLSIEVRNKASAALETAENKATIKTLKNLIEILDINE